MARGARRPKSAFRAELAELHALSISWRSGRTGMGTLTDARRGEMLLPELQMLDALELLAVASRLFPEGDLHGFDEVNQALACMAEQGPATGLEMAVWHLFDKAGWLGNLSNCWQCGVQPASAMRWQQAQLMCEQCAEGRGMLVSAGLRKSIAALLAGQRVTLSDRDVTQWRQMLRLAMQEQGVKPTDSFA